MRKNKIYTKEFKLEAVKLLEQGKQTGGEIAKSLGIRRNQLYKWREELKNKGEDAAFQGPGRPASENGDVVARLKRENAQLKEELEILKKAAAYFAREMK